MIVFIGLDNWLIETIGLIKISLSVAVTNDSRY